MRSLAIAHPACLLLLAVALSSHAASPGAAAGAKKAALCELCHTPTHVLQPVPLLEAQPARYLYARIKAFKEKRLPDPTMQTNVARLSERDMRDIAEYFASRPLARGAIAIDPVKAAAGAARLPALDCARCHGERLHGTSDVPRLAGQVPGYTIAQLDAFKAGRRDAPGHAIAAKLSSEEIEAVAHALARLE
jgi:cytochrome c553